MSWFKKSLANTERTKKEEILRQMNEPRPLPMGMKEFDEWSDRIISGALIPIEDPKTLKKVLASMIMSLGGQDSHKSDAYFIHSLRKAAANEVAHANYQKIKAEEDAALKARQEAELAKAAQQQEASVRAQIDEKTAKAFEEAAVRQNAILDNQHPHG